MISPSDIENWFTYHSPTKEQQEAYVQLRLSAQALAGTICALTPPSADQTAAIRKLRECVMTANAAIACGGK